ncbi:uncharacterized protein [Nicotiana tomentosiformis]|uniref:uncharacterized protein n=1 Tax=Nicotiana tomentosiformis TaxID=4098 RepID=UPI00388CC002
MDDLCGIRKDNAENVETSDGRNTPAQNELVLRLKQKILEQQGKLEKDKIQTLIDTKVIQAKEVAPNVRNNPLLDHRGGGVNMIETDKEWDSKGSIGLIREGDNSVTSPVTLTPIMVQTQAPIEVEVAAPTPFEVEITTPFIVMVAPTPSYKSNAIPWDDVAEARRKGKAKMEETGAVQGMIRTGRIYTPEYLGGISKEAASKPPVIETGPDDLWRKVQVREYSVVDHLNKTPAQISILSLLQNSEKHRNAVMKVLNEAYVPNNITSLHEIRAGSMNAKAFDGSQRATIEETNLSLQMGPTWFDVEFHVLDISATYNLLLGRPWIDVVRVVASTLHQAMNFEWNYREVIIHGDESNPIYTNQTVSVIENRRKLGGETYRRIERVNAIEKDKWWRSKIEGILAWIGYEPGKGLNEVLAGIRNLFLEDEDMDCGAIVKEEEEEEKGLIIQTVEEGVVLKNWTAAPSRARRVPG